MLSKLLRWARITKPGNDTGQFPVQQMEYMGKAGDGMIIFPYGHHGNVPADSLALMFAVQNNADNRAAIAWTPQTRPTLKAGEVAFYHPPTGTEIILDESGKINITSVGNVNITAPTMTLNGNLVVNGTMTNNGKDVGDTHQHAQGIDSAGNTQQNINGVL